MRRLGKNERARVKNRRYGPGGKLRRFRMWQSGPDVPGGSREFGPFGRRKAARLHRWLVREHLTAVRKAARESQTPKAGGTAVGPDSGTTEPRQP